MNLRKIVDGRQSVSWLSDVYVHEGQGRRQRTINREKTSIWPGVAQLSTPMVEKPAGDLTRPLVPQIPLAVDWVLFVQLNHPPVPIPLPIHHAVAPDDGSVFSSGTTWEPECHPRLDYCVPC